MEYRIVPDFPNARVGTDGSFWTRSVKCFAGTGNLRPLGEWVQRRAGSRQKDGYVLVRLRYGKRLWVTSLHALILTAFVGPRPKGMLGCHRNDDPSDNRLENLYWGTPTTNCEDRDRNGATVRGSKNNKAKITEADAAEIRRLRAEGVSRPEVSRRFGIHASQISRICSGKAWSHVGNQDT